MKKMILVPDPLKQLIAKQGGVFTRQQAMEAGVTRSVLNRFSREERWYSPARGLWSVQPRLDWMARVWGGLLLGGDGAVVGGQAAAALWGAARTPKLVTVWTDSRLRHQHLGLWQFRQGTRKAADDVEPARLPLAAAVVEMCRSGSVDDVVGHVSRAVGSRQTTASEIRQALEDCRAHPHRRLLGDVTHDHDSGAESPIERRYLIDVERAHGLPEGVRQAQASRRGFTDVAYEEYRLLVELDGRAFHEGLAALADMSRDNGNLLNGNTTLRYGLSKVAGAPCQVAGEVFTALRRLGRLDRRRYCPRCAP